MPRGGRRPGAGAKKGNLNALRSGARSKQLKAVIIALMAVPETRRVLRHFSRLEQQQRDLLGHAVNRYAHLLSLPSRERSIKAIRRQQIRNAVLFSETIKDPPALPPALMQAPAPLPPPPPVDYNGGTSERGVGAWLVELT